MHNHEVDIVSNYLNEKNLGCQILVFLDSLLNDKQHIIHNTKVREVFAFASVANNMNYMVIVDKREQNAHVFSETRYSFRDKEPIFSYERKNLNKPIEQIYSATPLLTINLVDKKQPNPFFNLFKESPKEIKKLVREWEIEQMSKKSRIPHDSWRG